MRLRTAAAETERTARGIRRGLVATATLGALVLAPLGQGVPAFAATAGASQATVQDDGTDVVDNSDPGGRQAELTDFKAWIVALPGIETSGYIESVNDAATASTVLLWHGDSPLQQTVIEHGAALGIRVAVRQRDYDRPTLEAAARDLVNHPEQIPGFEVADAVAITADYDGVIVEGTAKDPSAGTRTAPVRTMSVRAAGPAGSPAVDVRAKLVEGGAPAPITATRQNDFSPFNAGGFMLDPTVSQVCTSGFAIRRNGTNYTTTARHCYYHHYRAHDGSASYGDGVVNSGDGAGRQMSAGGSALMFDGAYNNSAGYKKTVIGYAAVSIGDNVCDSGGNSGVHCGITIDSAGIMWNDGMGLGLVSTIGATRSAGAAATYGDSGGPVFVTAGTDKVRAVGMLQWASLNNNTYLRTCSNKTNQLVCSNRIGFTLMSVIVNTIPGASLVTD